MIDPVRGQETNLKYENAAVSSGIAYIEPWKRIDTRR